MSEINAFKAPDQQKYVRKLGPEANREKTTMKLKHINFEPILEPFWPHIGVLGRPLEPFWASWGQLEPT